MQTIAANETLTRCEILADALGDTIAELRLIEAGDMIAYVRDGQWANISDLVQSSAELSFEEGALSFAYSGAVDVSWGAAPSVALDMEFQAHELTAFFTLTISSSESLVRIKDVIYATPPSDETTATRVFARSIGAARKDRR